MSELNHPILKTKTILKATVAALIISAIVLVVAVLPAEYGVDPLGAGKMLGFNKLYNAPQPEESMQMAAPTNQKPRRALRLENGGSGPSVPIPVEVNDPEPAQQFSERQDSIRIIIPAGEGIEYKINMLKHGKIKYEWSTDAESVFFDFHGEVKQKNPSKDVYYDSYTVAYSNNMIGSFLSPFEGRHGWYFMNSSDRALTITIRLKGQYEITT